METFEFVVTSIARVALKEHINSIIKNLYGQASINNL